MFYVLPVPSDPDLQRIPQGLLTATEHHCDHPISQTDKSQGDAISFLNCSSSTLTLQGGSGGVAAGQVLVGAMLAKR